MTPTSPVRAARLTTVVSSLWLVVALAGLAQAQTTTWEPIDLGTLGGTSVDTSTANGINNRGDVVGSSTIYGQTHAFLWTAADGMRDLGTLGGASSTARSINEARHVVGASDLGPDVRHAFVWTDAGGMVDIGTLGGATSDAFAINNLGQVVGTSLVATGERHPFLWTEATGMTDLASALGDTAAPMGINDAGQIVGNSGAFSWTPSGGLVLLPRALNALGVNKAGAVTGSYSHPAYLYPWVYIWTAAGGMRNFEPYGGEAVGVGINDAGEIVVTSFAGPPVGYVLAATGLVLLPALPGAPPLSPRFGSAISNAGVAGYAATVPLGRSHAVFWCKPGACTAPVIGSQPQNQAVLIGQTATLSVGATGQQPLLYQWYLGASGTTSNPVSGATSSSYTTPPLTVDVCYWVRVTNSLGSADSATATLTVGTLPVITVQPASQTIASGGTALLSVTATGTAPLIYQWYQGTSGSTGSPIAGAASSAFTTPALTTTTSYWVRVSSAFGMVNSATATITIGVAPIITMQPESHVIVSGQSVVIGVTATGQPPISYQWYQGTSGNTGSPIAGATLTSFRTPVLTMNTSYWVRVTNAFGTADSVTATITVGAAPAITAQPQDLAVNEGESATLAVVATGTPPLSYQWYEGNSGVINVPVPGATAATLTTPLITSVQRYWVRVSSPYGLADSVSATVTPIPLVAQPSAFYVKSMSGNTLTLAWAAGQGQEPVTSHLIEGGVFGQTEVLAQLATGSGATTFDLIVPNGTWWAHVRAAAGSTIGAPSAPIRLCINTPCPAITPENLLGLVSGSDISLAWRNPLESGVPTKVTLLVSGSLTAAFDLPGTADTFTYRGVPDGTYDLRVVACTASGCSAATGPLTLSFPGSCAGRPDVPARFMASKRGNTITVDWELPEAGPAPTGYLLTVTGSFVGTLPTTGRRLAGTVGPGSYTISVAGVNACGTGTAATPITVTIP